MSTSIVTISQLDTFLNKHRKGVMLDFNTALLELGFNSELVEQWLYIRKKKKAINTVTAFKLFITEYTKAQSKQPNFDVFEYIVGNGWKGFRASWIEDRNTTKNLETKDKRLNFILSV